MILNYEELLADFNRKLVTQLRSHGSGSECLETWVPDEDPVMSILNMVEAARSAGVDTLTVRFSATTMDATQRAALTAEVERIAPHSVITQSDGGFDLLVHGAKSVRVERRA